MVKLLPTLFKGSLTEVKGVLFETEKKYFQSVAPNLFEV